MSNIMATLRHALGIVSGIHIPGVPTQTATVTHSIQQHLADTYGEAAKALAAKLGATPGMTGLEKLGAITTAIVSTAKRDGFKGVEHDLFHAAVSVAQEAFRASLPTIEADTIALASSLSANPLVKLAAELVVPAAFGAVEKAVGLPPAPFETTQVAQAVAA